ncbi:hypothetical protein JA33_091 [Dickeya phage vB_DsoM_JA33]|uniref:Uncharacterized protein n=4 Tax=Salmondvirus TaxID=2733130 RepID=A0A384ZW77_9CAUD|nr:hypothetical protein HOU08_gp094 [Dickeya phage vB_DsoM_JA29]YP_009813536.1 hypothetical protein HOU32_gp091 [Dickeya phage vB_DsoM_JA11]AXG66495.1 hypothetical protein JA13_092 [Dickeya phage vB_DsoM_JA13]AXG67465.1 hypothetical protein JA33_091 [Dickeya phage vB_DsoM_JA33]AXG66820.1 hypothetical protein JA29_094 [Dickeya phage vB_DsoM_JA29]AYD79896.1 hypothetical protein JA11_091 [Dickeya phage vB_DsoM_JA11]
MPAIGRLAIKNPSTGAWISNLTKGGMKVRWTRPDGVTVWVRMTPNNTKLKNPNYGQPNEPEFISLV